MQKLVFLFFYTLLSFSLAIAQGVNLLDRNKDTVSESFASLNTNLQKELKSNDGISKAKAHLKLGLFCQENGVFVEAINQFNYGLLSLENEKQDNVLLDLINSLGILHLELKNYRTSEGYFKRGIEEALKQENKLQLAIAKSYLGACFEKQKLYKEALQLQDESLILYTHLKSDNGLCIVHENIGSIYEDLEQYDLALEHFNKALKYHGEQALETAKLCSDLHEQASSFKDLAENYQLLGKLDKALTYLEQFIILDNANQQLQSTIQATALQIVYDTKEKEAQIKILVQKGKVDYTQKIMLIASIISGVLLVLFWYLYILKKKMQTRNETIYKQQILKAELDKKSLKEEILKREVEVKNASLSTYSLHISQKNKILSDLAHTLTKCLDRNNIDLKRKLAALIQEINTNLSQDQEWEEFVTLFQEIHPQYIERINKVANNNLSSSELRLSMLLRLNLNSKEIASILRLTTDSVRVSRYRLRKKLPIDAKEELSQYLRSI